MIHKRDKLHKSVALSTKPKFGFAVDHAAFACAVLIAGLGVVQFVAPHYASALTGLSDNVIGNGFAILWIALGSLLALSIVTANRAMTSAAALVMFISGVASFAVAMVERPDIINILIHGAIAFLGATTCEVAQLTRKEQLRQVMNRAKVAIPQMLLEEPNGDTHA